MDKFNKFYKKSIQERRNILIEENYIEDFKELDLIDDKANVMIENYIYNYQLPMGLAFNFEIDNEKLIIPMAIEEPSVIAAASNGAKILGNITTELEEKSIIGQIVLSNVEDMDAVSTRIRTNSDKFMQMANDHFASMIKRGGGPKNMWVNSFSEGYVTTYFSVDTCDAMGANSINTFLEMIGSEIEQLTNYKPILQILSNNATESLVKASVRCGVDRLSKDLEEGIYIAKRIEEATNYAAIDTYRAATHNKGIMNGVDAVVIATGNDFRAVEASAHTFASKDNHYKPLTKWEYIEDTKELFGEIQIPMPVATVGGTISVNEMAKFSRKILNNPDAKRLAEIIAAVGLVQNFAALKSLVTEGIQKGHMSLHARSVAKKAGATDTEIEYVVKELLKAEKINIDNASIIIEKMRNDNE